jgi:hypothetical protein
VLIADPWVNVIVDAPVVGFVLINKEGDGVLIVKIVDGPVGKTVVIPVPTILTLDGGIFIVLVAVPCVKESVETPVFVSVLIDKEGDGVLIVKTFPVVGATAVIPLPVIVIVGVGAGGKLIVADEEFVPCETVMVASVKEVFVVILTGGALAVV